MVIGGDPAIDLVILDFKTDRLTTKDANDPNDS